MRENRYFVIPVNITHSRLRAPRFLGPHDTLPCVLIIRAALLLRAREIQVNQVYLALYIAVYVGINNEIYLRINN